MKKYVLGIDFGHGETSAAVIDTGQEGSVIPIQDLTLSGSDSRTVPSVIFKAERDGKWHIGPSTQDLRNSIEVASYFKGALLQSGEYPGMSETDKSHFRIFMKLVFEKILASSYLSAGENPNFELYAACPSGWNAVLVKKYEDFISESLNFPVTVIRESEAALAFAKTHDPNTRGFLQSSGNVLIIDFGSSTVDFTYYNGEGKPSSTSFQLGGSRVEQDIFKYMHGKESAAKDAYARMLELKSPSVSEEKIRQNILYALRRRKEEYYRSDDCVSFNPGIPCKDIVYSTEWSRYDFFDCDSDDGYTDGKLTQIILKQYVAELENMLLSVKRQFMIDRPDGVILTGGASKMTFFQNLVHKVFNVSKPHTLVGVDNPSLNTSRGIAYYGYCRVKGIALPFVGATEPAKKEPAAAQKISQPQPRVYPRQRPEFQACPRPQEKSERTPAGVPKNDGLRKWAENAYTREILTEYVSPQLTEGLQAEFAARMKKVWRDFVQLKLMYSQEDFLTEELRQIYDTKYRQGSKLKFEAEWRFTVDGLLRYTGPRRSVHSLCIAVKKNILGMSPCELSLDCASVRQDILFHARKYGFDYRRLQAIENLDITAVAEIGGRDDLILTMIENIAERLFTIINRRDSWSGVTEATFYKDRITMEELNNMEPLKNVMLSYADFIAPSEDSINRTVDNCLSAISKAVDSVYAGVI